MFRIKVCGLTNVDDAQMVVTAGADAIGLNFYPQSSRCIDPRVGRAICMAVPPDVVRVGVFVNATLDDICGIIEDEDVRLDMVQLHGDEPPEFILGLAKKLAMPVIRAFRLQDNSAEAIAQCVKTCGRWACTPRMILVDAYRQGSYGGTGKTADWSAIANLPRIGIPPLVLAGGLTPANVAKAIATTWPAAVDVASGVESSPGRKDPLLVEQFVKAVHGAMLGDFA